MDEAPPPIDWVLPNRALFPQWVYDKFGKMQKESDGVTGLGLFPHQVFVREFLGKQSPFRGLLLYHGLGVGKTCAAIALAELLHGSSSRVIVMTQKSLKKYFQFEMQKCGSAHMLKNQKWLVDDNGVSPSKDGKEYVALSEVDQDCVKKHLERIVESRYVFVNYNGLLHRHLEERFSENYFDDALVIIDEAHRFVSRAKTPTSVCHALYGQLFKSTARFVLLSGTPIINAPFEVSLLLNLIRGQTRVVVVRVLQGSATDDMARRIRDDNDTVDHVAIRSGVELAVTLLPKGFSRSGNFTTRKLDQSRLTSENLVLPSGCQQLKIEDGFNLPMEEDVFNRDFIDFDNLTVRNPMLFVRRIQGLVSHFDKRDKDIYPTVHTRKVIRLQMSDHQFGIYSNVRISEIKKERAAKQREKGAPDVSDNNPFKKKGNVYKPFSRAVCNFAFPEGIERPYPSRMKGFLEAEEEEEMIEDEDALDALDAPEEQQQHTGGGSGKGGDKEYKAALNRTLNKLVASGKLAKESIATLSPKMAAVASNVGASQGPCLIYSEFKTAEGMRIMSMVLEAQGYARLVYTGGSLALTRNSKKVSRGENKWAPKKIYVQHEPDDPVASPLIMDIFNGDFANVPASIIQDLKNLVDVEELDNRHGDIVRAILISVSGSEGISLKNIRQVHLIEPFWNDIRVQQVIGRAVRANSHSALPEEERFVDIFQYIVYMPEMHKNENFLLRTADSYRSADELVFDISQKKLAISKQFLRLMREGSVDCNIHNEGVGCFNHDTRLGDADIAVPTMYQDDMGDSRYAYMLSKTPDPPRPIKVLSLSSTNASGEQVHRSALLLSDGALIDADVYKVMKRHHVIGQATLGDDGTSVIQSSLFVA